MKIKVIWVMLSLIIALSMVLVSCAKPAPTPTPTPTSTATPTPTPTPTTEAPPEVIELTFANYFPPAASQSKMLEQFCKDVEEQTGGKIKFNYYTGGTLLTGPAVYQGIVDGVADIGYSAIHYTPGRFPVTEVITSTLGWPSAWVGAHVAMEFYNKYKPAEWDDVKVLWIQANMPKVLATKKPVRTLADLKGLIIRAAGSAGDIITALGGTPSSMQTSEMADAISKGTLDGAYLPYETLKTYKTADVAKFVTTCWQVGSTDCFYLVMNKDAYKKLEALPEAKAIFDRICGQYFEYFSGLVWNQIDFAGVEYAKSMNVQFIDLSAAELTKWQNAAEPAVEKYKTTMVGKGYSAAEVQGWIDFIKERIDYWTAQQELLKIPSATGTEKMQHPVD